MDDPREKARLEKCKATGVKIANSMNWHIKSEEEKKTYKQKICRAYQISVVEFDRMYQIQQGMCAICNRHQTELKKCLLVDHDHVTGKVRGLLCDKCNGGLGWVENKEFTVKATEYLLSTPYSTASSTPGAPGTNVAPGTGLAEGLFD